MKTVMTPFTKEQNFGRAFSAGPDPAKYFAQGSLEKLRESISRCIDRGDGPAVVLGATGVGKSLLLALLEEQFGRHMQIAHLKAGNIRTPSELYQALSYKLQIPVHDTDDGGLKLALMRQLESEQADVQGVLMLVDEAHTLSPELIDELRMLTNVVKKGTNWVRLVLAGTTQLEENLTDPCLDSFNQRIAVRGYVKPFARGEMEAYIRHQLELAGVEADMLTKDAIAAVWEISDGVARIINQICDHALLLNMAQGEAEVDAQLIKEAWADLQQLPAAPFADNSKTSDGSSHDIIEFGELDAGDDPSTELELRIETDDDEPAKVIEFAAYVKPQRGDDDDEQQEFSELGPDDRIESIQRQLEEVDEVIDEVEQAMEPADAVVDFTPPGGESNWPQRTIHATAHDEPLPLDEVASDDPRDLFGSRFAQEEIVAQPYAHESILPAGAGTAVRGDVADWIASAGALDAASEFASVVDQPIAPVPLLVQTRADIYSLDPVLPEDPTPTVAQAELDDADAAHLPLADALPSHDTSSQTSPLPKPKKYARLFTQLRSAKS